MDRCREGEGKKKVDFNTAYFIHAYNPAFAKDFHNNGLVLPLLRGSAGVIVDVELTKILLKAKLRLWLSQMQYFCNIFFPKVRRRDLTM